MPRVIIQNWDEHSETTRPSGYTIHASLEDHRAYCNAHWDVQVWKPLSFPGEYTAEAGKPFWGEIDHQTYERLLKSTHGIWGGLPEYFRGTQLTPQL